MTTSSISRRSPRFRAAPALVATLAAAVLSAASALPAAAQNATLFTWAGLVTREVRLTVRDGNVSETATRGLQAPVGRARVQSVLPQQPGTVGVQLTAGSGQADVIQQPSAQNSYTAIVRIRGTGNGSEMYRLTTYWTAAAYTSNGRYPNAGYPNGDVRGNGRGNNGRGIGNGGSRRYPDGDRRNGYPGNGYPGNGYPNNGAGYATGALQWSGDVDDQLEIRWRAGRVTYRNLSGNSPRNVAANVSGTQLTAAAVRLTVTPRSGRGSVYVAEQPSARNNYTAVIVVRDADAGYGHYDFQIGWEQ